MSLLVLTLAVALVQDTAPGRGVPLDGAHNKELSGATYDRRHALVIGIDSYGDPTFPDLGCAVADAEAVAKILIEKYGFAKDDVRLLVNEDATKRALESALEEWACDPDRVSKEDQLVVFFAGHGITRTSGRGNHGYLVPVDGASDGRGEPAWSSLLGMRYLETVSELIPAKHVLFILDSCFSGLAVTRSAPPVAAGLSNRARQVITAGNADQTVLDTGGIGHSVFTGALLDALNGNADLDNDQVVTFGELFNYVGREVERKTEGRQTPLQAAFRDHEGGNVALFPPGVKPGRMTAAERLRALEGTLEERLAELERLSDYVFIRDFVKEADALWPARPEMIPRYRGWLMRARELLDRKPQHEATVRQVRQEAYLSQVVAGQVGEGEGTEPVWSEVDPKLRWRYQTVLELVSGLEGLEAGLLAEDGVSEEHGWSIPQRLAFAKRLEDGFAPAGEFAVRWEDALPSIRKAYPGLDLAAQWGLVPIGVDPSSRLWEFWDVQSGVEPMRDEGGGLVLEEGSGLVFVLLPGGTFWMGASTDPDGHNYDKEAQSSEEPVHSVELSAFFLSKYEMTQGQWKQLTGWNRSQYGPDGQWGSDWMVDGSDGDLLQPVTNVSWTDCYSVMRRWGLTLPSEAQWEYGCRGGSSSVYWSGDAKEDLRGVANLADEYARDHGGSLWPQIQDWLDDGYTMHAPVDGQLPNAFGLHHVHGNVWEWCLDGYDENFYERSHAVDPVSPHEGSAPRVLRGGCFFFTAVFARSAHRFEFSPVHAIYTLGLRPARLITK